MAGMVITVMEIRPTDNGDLLTYVGTARTSAMGRLDGAINWSCDALPDKLNVDLVSQIKTAAVDAARVAGITINPLLDKISVIGLPTVI